MTTVSSTPRAPALEYQRRAPGESLVGAKSAGSDPQQTHAWRNSPEGKAYCKRSRDAITG